MKTEVHEWEDKSRTEYQYDNDGNQTRTTNYNADGTVACDVQYENNQEGDCIGWKVYYDEGRLIGRFEVDRFPSGLEAEIREYDGEGNFTGREVYSYDSNSRIKETHQFDGDNVLCGSSVYEWDVNGELTIKHFDLEGNNLDYPAG